MGSQTSNPDSILTDFDRDVTNDVEMIILNNDPNGQKGTRVKFQFPPKVISEQKRANFITVPYTAGWEPIKWYIYSEARALTLEAEWIATGDSANNFSAGAIAEMMRDIKRYFYQASPKGKTYPAVRLKIWEIVPKAAFFRLHGLTINFGPEITKDANANVFYPLYSKATFNLELVTNLSAEVS